MSKTPRVLLVCTGNTCRSPMAEVFLRQQQPDWEIQSAGIQTRPGLPASSQARTVALSRGLSLEEHASQPVTAALVGWADQIYCMTEGHRQSLLQQFPLAREKTALLSTGDIADPYGQSLSVYEQSAREIEQAILSRLQGRVIVDLPQPSS